MTVRKITLIGLLILLILFGCRAPQVDVKRKPKVAFLAYDLQDTFVRMLADIITEASGEYAEIIIKDAQNSSIVQERQIYEVLKQGAESVIVNIVDRSKSYDVMNILKEKNIPVVFINREPDESAVSDWDMSYYVGARPMEAGHMSVEILLDYFNAHPEADLNKDRVVQYAVFAGDSDHQDAVFRTQAYKEGFKELFLKQKFSGCELVKVSADWDRGTAKNKMREILKEYEGQIEAVLANNDDMALGVIDALTEAGYFGGEKFMPVVGIDGTQESLRYVAEGIMIGTVLNNAVYQGSDALYIASSLANRERPVNTSVRPASAGSDGDRRYLWIPYRKITEENYRGYLKK